MLRDFRNPGAVLFSLLLFFQFGNEWSMAGWLPLFLIRRLGISPKDSLLLLALYWASLLVGRIISQFILKRVNRALLLIGSIVSALLGMIVLASTNNLFGALMGILFVGAGFASIYPLVVEKIAHRFPYYHPGFYNGLFSLAMTGGFLAPWLLGYFAEAWGIQAVMILPLGRHVHGVPAVAPDRAGSEAEQPVADYTSRVVTIARPLSFLSAAIALLVPLATAAELSSRLDHLIDSAVPLSHAFVGMRVVRLSDGRVLYAHNSERLFVPASNMKLFTTALALSKLGAEYRLTTQIGAEVPIDAEGTLPGDLELVGGGDPSLSGREYPYRSHAAPLAIYSFRAMDDMADQLVAARGLKRDRRQCRRRRQPLCLGAAARSLVFRQRDAGIRRAGERADSPRQHLRTDAAAGGDTPVTRRASRSRRRLKIS